MEHIETLLAFEKKGIIEASQFYALEGSDRKAFRRFKREAMKGNYPKKSFFLEQTAAPKGSYHVYNLPNLDLEVILPSQKEEPGQLIDCSYYDLSVCKHEHQQQEPCLCDPRDPEILPIQNYNAHRLGTIPMKDVTLKHDFSPKEFWAAGSGTRLIDGNTFQFHKVSEETNEVGYMVQLDKDRQTLTGIKLYWDIDGRESLFGDITIKKEGSAAVFGTIYDENEIHYVFSNNRLRDIKIGLVEEFDQTVPVSKDFVPDIDVNILDLFNILQDAIKDKNAEGLVEGIINDVFLEFKAKTPVPTKFT